MSIRDDLQFLDELFVHNRLYRSSYIESAQKELDDKILAVYYKILHQLAYDYDVYKENVSELCSILSTIDNSLTYQLKYFRDKLTFINNIKTTKFDDSIISNPIDENNDFLDLYYKNFSSPDSPKEIFFTDELDLGIYNEFKFKNYLNLLIKIMHKVIENIDTSIKDLHDLMLDYIFGRQIAIKINQLELLYQCMFMYLERWISLGHNQIARDKGATFLYSSFLDNIPEYGFLISFYVSASQGNLSDALMYGSICLIRLKDIKIIGQKYMFQFVYAVMKMYRNADQLNYLIDLYSNLPKKFIETKNEEVQIDFIYYSAIISRQSRETAQHVIDYVFTKLAYFIEKGEEECIPWLTLFYNFKRFEFNFDLTKNQTQAIDYIIKSLEVNVNREHISMLKNVALGDIDTIKKYLTELLNNLNETRHVDDFVIDIDKAMIAANSLLVASYTSKDIDGFVRAMTVKADVSNEFKNDFAVHFMSTKHVPKAKIFTKHINFKKIKSNLTEKDILVFLGEADLAVYQLELYIHKEIMTKFKKWDINKFFDWITDKLPNLLFSDTKKDKRDGLITQMFHEDYLDQSNAIKKEISFFQTNNKINGNILLIKDMRLSGFPHNLIIGEDGEYLHLKNPIIDVVNANYFDTFQDEKVTLSEGFQIGMWIPTEGGDFAIEYLAAKMETVIAEANIKTFKSLLLDAPLNYDINIIVAHGEKGIKSFNALYINETKSTTRLDLLVGKGAILILFVCHSGSMQEARFSYKVESLTRQYIELGYQAVIAPFWALSIMIPPIWLPVFLGKLKEDNNVSEAVFYANQEIYKFYPTPVAWACMHAYGNPKLKVE